VTPGVPADLVAALDRLSEGVSRAELAQRASAISETYRAGGGSAIIKNETDALAYALVRMPATLAAVAACLAALQTARPDFAPQSMIDVGAGPGTATWAASDAFPSLEKFALADTNENLRALALTLMRGNGRLRRSDYRLGGARAFLNGAADADLVVASYVVGELDEAERTALVDLMWQRSRDALLIVEPGTPAGYARIIALRAQLIAEGAHVIAPCPHDSGCPLLAPDWCHFAQRLPRSRAHKQVKGADVPFEDEKFSYVVLSRVAADKRLARVLSPPSQSKAAIAAKLCTANGLVLETVQRRDKDAYAKARRWRWGDAVASWRTSNASD
jgi:ribosomal protein RSM22 (predicted rRNA methylase)